MNNTNSTFREWYSELEKLARKHGEWPLRWSEGICKTEYDVGYTPEESLYGYEQEMAGNG